MQFKPFRFRLCLTNRIDKMLFNTEDIMKNLILKSAVVLIVLCFVTTLSAQPGRKQKEGREKFQSELNLTEQQKEQMQQFRLDHKTYVLDIKHEIQKNRLEIEKLLMADNLDESKLLQLTNQSSDLKAKIKDSKMKMWLDTFKILNPDQQKIWKKKLLRMGNKIDRGQKGIAKGLKGKRPERGQKRDRRF